MDVNERIETKRSALLRAESHDLDLAAVALSTVSMIFAEVFPSMIPELPGAKTPLAELSTSITDSEERLIRAIDWLSIHESTHRDAIAHVNALMRLFLNNGRLNAARVLLFDLPTPLMEGVVAMEADGDEQGQAMEFVHWRSFFDALTHHLRYFEVWSKQPSGKTSKVERHNWIKALDGIVELTETSIMQILQMDWLKFDFASVQDIQAERRQTELARIRQMYVPELVFRLHFMLVEVCQVLPQ